MVRMYLRGNTTLEIPVLPDVLKVASDGQNETEQVLVLGEVNVLKARKLRVVSWDCHFPANRAPYVSGLQLLRPLAYIQIIETWRQEKRPLRFILTGTDLDVNTSMAVEKLGYEERGGEPGDIYYQLELKEYKDYSPRRITISADGRSVVQAPQRTGASPVYPRPGSYMVVAGDTLWSIAQRFYGDGGQYERIYTANKSQMDLRNNATGNTRYTIYTGQVLNIP